MMIWSFISLLSFHCTSSVKLSFTSFCWHVFLNLLVLKIGNVLQRIWKWTRKLTVSLFIFALAARSFCRPSEARGLLISTSSVKIIGISQSLPVLNYRPVPFWIKRAVWLWCDRIMEGFYSYMSHFFLPAVSGGKLKDRHMKTLVSKLFVELFSCTVFVEPVLM